MSQTVRASSATVSGGTGREIVVVVPTDVGTQQVSAAAASAQSAAESAAAAAVVAQQIQGPFPAKYVLAAPAENYGPLAARALAVTDLPFQLLGQPAGLGGAALLNVGGISGTVADGGALTSEIATVTAAISSLQALISALQAGKLPQGTYNAATNTPNLSSVGPAGDYYEVSVAGTPSIPGDPGALAIGDQIVSTGTVWYPVKLGSTYAPILNPALKGAVGIGSDLLSYTSVGGSLFCVDQGGCIIWSVDPYGNANFTSVPGGIVNTKSYQQTGIPDGVYFIGQDGCSFLSISKSISLPNNPVFPGTSASFAGLTYYSQTGIPQNTYEIGQDGCLLSALTSTASGGGSISGTFTSADLAYYNSKALSHSASVRGQVNTTAQRATHKKNVIVVYGQSWFEGWLGGAALSNTQVYDVQMIGNSVRGTGTTQAAGSANFNPTGGSFTLNPAKAATQSIANGAIIPFGSVGNRAGGFSGLTLTFDGNHTLSLVAGTTATMETWTPTGGLVSTPVGAAGQPAIDFTQIFDGQDGIAFGGPGVAGAFAPLSAILTGLAGTITPASIALNNGNFNAVPAGTQVSGISLYVTNDTGVVVGEEGGLPAANFYRRLQLALRGLETDPTRQIVILNCCIGGTTMAQLSKGATPDYYNQMMSAVQQLVALEGPGNVAVIGFDLGDGGTDNFNGTPTATYISEAAALIANARADFVALTNQKNPPMVTIQQTGRISSVATSDSVAYDTAILGLCASNPDYYAIWSDYPYTHYNQHSPPNSYRAFGKQLGKIRYKVLDAGEGWAPPQMIGAVCRSNQVLVWCHVPAPPLRAGTSYNEFTPVTASTLPTLGFNVIDLNGQNSVIAATISDDAIVVLTCARAIVGPGTITYGDLVYNAGGGVIKDSDPMISDDVYVYNDFGGQLPQENISGLVGLPYDMSNWMAIHSVPFLAG